MRGIPIGALLAGLCLAACARSPAPPDVVLVSWDSARADHLSAYAYERPTTPHLEELARRSVLFEQAYAQHNWTRPSYHSLLSGLHNWELPDQRLSPEVELLQERLAHHGYRTVGLVQNPNLAAEFGFDAGFDHYERLDESWRPEAATLRALELLGDQDTHSEPLFFFFHLQGPHFPLPTSGPWVDTFRRSSQPPFGAREVTRILSRQAGLPDGTEPAAAQRYLVDLYDAALRESDEAFGALLDALARRTDAAARSTLLIFTADHGEELGDRRGFGHAHENLYPELTRVPLIIRFPKGSEGAPTTIDATVRLIDLYPTILDVAGVEIPRGLSGRSLLPLESIGVEPRLAISSIGGRAVFRKGRWAIHLAEDGEVLSIHDRSTDPTERHAVTDPVGDPDLERLRRLALSWHAAWPGAEEEAEGGPALSEALRESLRALGYVD